MNSTIINNIGKPKTIMRLGLSSLVILVFLCLVIGGGSIAGIYTSNAFAQSNDTWISITETSNGDGNTDGDGNTTCNYSIDPTSLNLDSDISTAFNLIVTTDSGCEWTAESNDSWISLENISSESVSADGNSYFGDGNITIVVSENTNSTERTGTATIAGETFTAIQPGRCNYSIDPTSKNIDYTGEDGIKIDVSTDTGCEWTAVSNDSWITITGSSSEGSGGGGGDGNTTSGGGSTLSEGDGNTTIDVNETGDGNITYSVSENTDTTERTGTITIAGETFTVTQGGAVPTPEIKANGSGDTVIITPSSGFTISIELAAGNGNGQDGDWWLVLFTPDGWYYYNFFTSWTFAGSSYTDLPPTHQGALFDLDTFEIEGPQWLDEGTHTFYFAIDTDMNGVLDVFQMYFDSVEVNISGFGPTR